MINSEEKTIKLNKASAQTGIIILCTLTVISFFAYKSILSDNTLLSANKNIVKIVSVIFFLLFGLTTLMLTPKLSSTKPGLTLNATGIIDNSSMALVGLIPWSEITGFTTTEFKNQKLFIIKVSNPEKYFIGDHLTISKIKKFKWALNKEMFDQFGSPVVINFKSLQIDHNELIKICQYYFEQYHPDKSSIF